ncbi:MAG: flavin reductase [Puniceicoccaceae bacterium 5H]|nr:MAG: flavin reductase [Puniceicoccaceae bacterium 5H]
MTHLIVPRPIAWVLTRNENGSHNLAPFSYCNAVTSNPPIVSISIGRRDGEQKDTLRNLERERQAVIHLPSVEELDAVNQSSKPLPPEISEVEAQGLPLVQDDNPLPRLASSKAVLYASLYAVHEIGEGQQALVLCQVDRVFLSDELGVTEWDEKTDLPVEKLNPLARLGGTHFARLGETLSRPRPE